MKEISMANNLTTTSTQADLGSESPVFFNNYLQPNFNISSDLNSAVLAQFEKITGHTESARILASSVIYTSLAQKVDPMLVVDKIRTMSKEESMTYLGLFLNLNRVGTSFLGVKNRPRVSKYVERCLLP